MSLEVEAHRGVAELPSGAWDALFGNDDPFARHAFLAGLEASGSVGKGTGWAPVPLVARRGGAVVGALPLYVKSHSFGEYIFDFEWAHAARHLGVRYYPKLVAMVPFTPATGARLGVASGEDRRVITHALLEGARTFAARIDASSVHLLFLREDELALAAEVPGFLPRASLQYHFTNDGYRDFEDLLARFRSPIRKQIRRERRAVREAGIEVELVEGASLDETSVRAVAALYESTCDRKGGTPYLEPAFFERLRGPLGHAARLCLARKDGELVAMSLAFEQGAHLYGRYWGSRVWVDGLHFELCYYRFQEYAIARGLRRFEAGAQGEHKIKRGFLPTRIHSAHHVRDEGLARALASFLPREARAVEAEIAALAEHGPFHRG